MSVASAARLILGPDPKLFIVGIERIGHGNALTVWHIGGGRADRGAVHRADCGLARLTHDAARNAAALPDVALSIARLNGPPRLAFHSQHAQRLDAPRRRGRYCVGVRDLFRLAPKNKKLVHGFFTRSCLPFVDCLTHENSVVRKCRKDAPMLDEEGGVSSGRCTSNASPH